MKRLFDWLLERSSRLLGLYLGLGALVALGYPTLEQLGWNRIAVLAVLVAVVVVELARVAKNSRERGAKESGVLEKLLSPKVAAPAPSKAPAHPPGPSSAMIDRTGLSVSDFDRSRAFYDAALAPLGYGQLVGVPPEQADGTQVAGYGRARPQFWITEGAAQAPPAHVAFTSDTRIQVDAFHRAALGAGGTDIGAPGLHPLYHHDACYAACVRDPDGNTIEAVCHAPPPQ
jgi:catechol 2,3-dioxygenase-like lactoylglutathione lyase family enzyme